MSNVEDLTFVGGGEESNHTKMSIFILMYHKIEVPVIAKSVFNLIYIVITIKVN